MTGAQAEITLSGEHDRLSRFDPPANWAHVASCDD